MLITAGSKFRPFEAWSLGCLPFGDEGAFCTDESAGQRASLEFRRRDRPNQVTVSP
jgi:hypothetical protein